KLVVTIDDSEGARVQRGGGLAGLGLEQRLAVDVHATITGHGGYSFGRLSISAVRPVGPLAELVPSGAASPHCLNISFNASPWRLLAMTSPNLAFTASRISSSSARWLAVSDSASLSWLAASESTLSASGLMMVSASLSITLVV